MPKEIWYHADYKEKKTHNLQIYWDETSKYWYETRKYKVSKNINFSIYKTDIKMSALEIQRDFLTQEKINIWKIFVTNNLSK